MQNKTHTFIKNTFGLIALVLVYNYFSDFLPLLVSQGDQTVPEHYAKFSRFYLWAFVFSSLMYLILTIPRSRRVAPAKEIPGQNDTSSQPNPDLQLKPKSGFSLKRWFFIVWIPVLILAWFILRTIGFGPIDRAILAVLASLVFTIIVITPGAIFSFFMSKGGTE